mgnify:CR=1 FL=1
MGQVCNNNTVSKRVLNKQFFGITHENNSMAKVMLSQKHKITECGSGEEYMISMYENIVFDKSSQQHFKTLVDILCNQYLYYYSHLLTYYILPYNLMLLQ